MLTSASSWCSQPGLLAVELEDGGGQAVEQVVEEHRPQRPGRLAGKEQVAQQGGGVEGVGQAEAVAAGVVGEDAVAGHVAQHPLGAVGQEAR
jgi:hypothetical protein